MKLSRRSVLTIALALASITMVTRTALCQGAGGNPFVARFHYAIEDLSTGLVVRRGTTGEDGIPATNSIVVAPDTEFRYWVVDTSEGLIGSVEFTTPSSGIPATIPSVGLGRSFTSDFDGDGLHDDAEFVLGTSAAEADSDGDGILDGAEIAQGLDPLEGTASRTGVIGSTGTDGTAIDVTAADDIAVVAREDRGISVFNVFNGMDPINILILSTPGTSQRVAFSGDWIAVADGDAGLALIDVSDVRTARIVHQVDLGSSVTAVATAGKLAYAGLQFGGMAVVDLETGSVVDGLFLAGVVRDIFVADEFVYVLSDDALTTTKISSGPLIRVGAIDSPFVSTPNRRLFVGGGFAYTVHGQGYNTITLSDPEHPQLFSAGNTTRLGWLQLAPNGSGLAVAAVGPIPSLSASHDISLYDVSDPLQTNAFVTEFRTPGIARSVSIYNGIAYVADGDAGLQVINYLSSDVAGISPTITLAGSLGLDIELKTVDESKAVAVRATVTDDVQVRNVEFYLDRNKVFTDGNFPFEFRFTSPPLTQGSFLLQARASDTGGNAAFTEEILIEITPDQTPPQVVGVRPGDLNIAGDIRNVGAFFDEALDPASIGGASFLVVGAGADGFFNTLDDIEVPDGSLEYREEVFGVFRSFGGAALVPGLYAVHVTGSVSDLTGNSLERGFSWRFTVCDAEGDRDGDCIPDDIEDLIGLDADSSDSDRDGVPDCDEDSDGDGVANCVELILGTDLNNSDSDGDGIPDGDEDSDGDGILDAEEARLGTDPALTDSDGDGFSDGLELTLGTDPAGVTNFAEEDIEIVSKTIILDGPITFRSLTLRGGAVITHSGATESTESRLELTLESLVIDAGSAIDVSEQGYLGGVSGANTSTRGRTLGNVLGSRAVSITNPCCGSNASGGSYGGLGGVTSRSNPAYGNLFDPNDLGSGGAVFRNTDPPARNGGGLIRIVAQRTHIDGVIRANGGGIDRPAGGSGGGISIRTNVLSGTGDIIANGGDSTFRGGGGGGRIAVYYGARSGYSGKITARGGNGPEGHGAPGTVYLKAEAQGHGELIIDNVNLTPAENSTPLVSLAPGTSTELAANTLSDSSANFPIPNPGTRAPGLIGIELEPDASRAETFTIVGNTATQIFTDAADGDMTEVAQVGGTYVGALIFDRIELRRTHVVSSGNVITLDAGPLRMENFILNANGFEPRGADEVTFIDATVEVNTFSAPGLANPGGRLEVDGSTLTLQGDQTITALELKRGGIVTHPDATTTYEPRLELILGSLTIDVTSEIDVSGRGYLGGLSGDNTSRRGRTLGNALGARGVSVPCCGYLVAGGSYGGIGGWLQYTSPVYGDFLDPNALGSGGAVAGNDDGPATDGGGLVRITANSVVLDGAIRADGGDDGTNRRGGASGGGILIRTAALSGTGTLSATGSVSVLQGGGGGGRIAVYFDDISAFSGSMLASGGSGSQGARGGAGTIFKKSAAQIYGDLLFDNNNLSTVPDKSPLRSIGTGPSTAVAPNTLTDDAASYPLPNALTGELGLVGLELNPDELQSQTFTVIGNTATQIFTDPADGDMTGIATSGATYTGVYTFDNLTVRRRARVVTLDEIIVIENLTIESGGELNSGN